MTVFDLIGRIVVAVAALYGAYGAVLFLIGAAGLLIGGVAPACLGGGCSF